MVKYHLSLTESDTMERYRSGHNEAVLKTVCPQGRVGSNPTLSVEPLDSLRNGFYIAALRYQWFWRSTQAG